MLERYLLKEGLVAGCDEAGRGCLAGPVVAAAVILPEDFDAPLLNDSKLLSKTKRDNLRIQIEKRIPKKVLNLLSYATALRPHNF